MATPDDDAGTRFLRRLGSRVSDIPQLRQALAKWASQHGVPCDTTHCVNLILDELITNTITHGYRGQPGHQIEIDATVADSAVRVRVTDHAPAFDPLQPIPPDTSAEIGHRHIGGLGLLLARRLADEMSYRRLDPHGAAPANEVRFVKRFARLQPPANAPTD